MNERPVLLWLRQDLRLTDHPALVAAVRSGGPVIPVYVLDDETPGQWTMGGASRWWLGMSLPRLEASLCKAGSGLVIRRGPIVEQLAELAREVNAEGVYCSRSYEPWAANVEAVLKERLEADGVSVHRYSGALLVEPEAVATQAGDPFRVYSPFARAVDALPEIRSPLDRPRKIPAPNSWPRSLSIEDLGLLPTRPDWAGGLREAWTPGEAGATSRLAAFLDGPLQDYKAMRDRPDVEATSRLSPHLHFGEISPATCWHAVGAASGGGRKATESVTKFRRELLWREFSYHLLVHNPALPEQPFRPEFARFPWQQNDTALDAWKKGKTGYPIVDAGMRELWQTGYMHNRVRMIVASFLAKDLLLAWQAGAAWFWDTLVDADLANNSASWQWVAGCGADAAPYFRIFNPVKQGTTFDPDGAYVHRFVPELRRLPAPHVHAPFAAPAQVLAEAGVELGRTYPHPIVDHGKARGIALDAFAKIKGG
ncbi:MAG: deoxyribodipyrimidine photo-lyase [Hyphomicrobiaceae bacterium]